jgi:alpha-galactosidase
MITAKAAPITLAASVDRRDVLRGATAVICTVGVGGRRAWEQDVFIPRRHGIFAPVGDTVGPGGTSRALRMIPPMVAIARDVLDLAPDALFFNYGNPMAPVCRAIRKATGANVVGLCHGVIEVARYLAEALGVPLSALDHTAVGLNHLTWFVAVRAHGQDALPRLRQMAAQKTAFDDNPFSWSLLELFGAFPAVLDRHVTEFFPQFFREGHYYGKTLGVDAINFEQYIVWGDQIYAEMRKAAFGPEPLGQDFFDRLSGEHEQVIDIIASIRDGSGKI